MSMLISADKDNENVVMLCGRGMAEMLCGKDPELRGIIAVCGWIPDDDRHVFLVPASIWDKMEERATVMELQGETRGIEVMRAPSPEGGGT